MLYRKAPKQPLVHTTEWIRVHWKDHQGEWMECVWENATHAETILDRYVDAQGDDFVRIERCSQPPVNDNRDDATKNLSTTTSTKNGALEVIDSAHEGLKEPKGREPEQILATVRDLLAMLDKAEVEEVFRKHQQRRQEQTDGY